MDYLLTFVELSLGLAGVAALIAVFRDHKKRKWRRFQFLGLIMHAMIAFVFSLLPFLVNAFTKDLEITWAICSGVLSVQIISQITMVFIADKDSTFIVKLELFLFGLFTAIILILNALGIYYEKSIDAYYIGVLFHLLQGVLIFVLFILESDIGISENKQDNVSA